MPKNDTSKIEHWIIKRDNIWTKLTLQSKLILSSYPWKLPKGYTLEITNRSIINAIKCTDINIQF